MNQSIADVEHGRVPGRIVFDLAGAAGPAARQDRRAEGDDDQHGWQALAGDCRCGAAADGP